VEQWNAIYTLVPILKEDKAVRAIFLKGSLARGEGDKYSDVDLYCLVYEDGLEHFLNRRLDYLKKYKGLLFWTEVNFVAPQIVAVFNNGLHLDLYTVTKETLKQTDAVKILYDPEKLLSDYQKGWFELSKEEIVKIFDQLTFKLLEFEAAYKRKNMIWASRLASHISGDIVLLVRYIYDPKHAQLGFKKINNAIPEEIYQELCNALDKINPSNLPMGLFKLLELTDEIISKLPSDINDELNFKFYDFMSEKIKKLL